MGNPLSFQEVLRTLKERIDIVEVISQYVPLRRAGQKYRGPCPFHQDKDPSFYVFPGRNNFHCFGCGKHGDVLDFLCLVEGLSLEEVVRDLAERHGLPLAERRVKAGPSLEETIEMAYLLYRDTLRAEEKAVRLLRSRGLTLEGARAFSLGVVPTDPDLVVQRLRGAGVEDEQLLLSGLAVEAEGGVRSRFRTGVVFPLRNCAGRLIGLACEREDGKVDYTPNPLIPRGREIFPLEKLWEGVKGRGRVILVSTPSEAVKLHEMGYSETMCAVVPVGEEQARHIANFARGSSFFATGEIVLFRETLMGKGEKEMVDLVFPFLIEGIEVKVAGSGTRAPSSEVREQRGKAIENARPLIRFLAELAEGVGTDGPLQSLRPLRYLIDRLEAERRRYPLAAVMKETILREVSRSLGVSWGTLEAALRTGPEVETVGGKPGIRPLFACIWTFLPDGKQLLQEAYRMAGEPKAEGLLGKVLKGEDLTEREEGELKYIAFLHCDSWEETTEKMNRQDLVRSVARALREDATTREYARMRGKALSSGASPEELESLRRLARELASPSEIEEEKGEEEEEELGLGA